MRTVEFDGVFTIEIPDNEYLAKIYDTVKDTMQREDALKLMEEIKQRMERRDKENGESPFKSWSLTDKILWYVSEAYCTGFVNATYVTLRAVEGTIEEQVKGVQHND